MEGRQMRKMVLCGRKPDADDRVEWKESRCGRWCCVEESRMRMTGLSGRKRMRMMVLRTRKPDADDRVEWKESGCGRTCEMKDGLWLLAGVFLLACAYSDIRSGMISVKCCLFAAGAGMLIRILCVRGNAVSAPSWERLLCCLLPGLFVMGIAAGSGEQIGKGDAWILLTLGVLVGMRRCVSLFVAGLVISLPFAAVWHLTDKRRKEMLPEAEHEERSIPFAPSLLLAHLMLSFLT